MAFLLLSSLAPQIRAQAVQPDETLPGFKPNDVIGGGPVDHVNVYSGDTGIVLPLGPV
jgi:hypothetical protein